ncbi:hypothetical protein Pelo_11136 [Pelomyxa schiedti]|nr:hypothetical protein Pelo_11136 [Pelomyxa schiedti]
MMAGQRPRRMVWIVGFALTLLLICCVVAERTDPKSIEEFREQLGTGRNLKNSDARSLYNSLIANLPYLIDSGELVEQCFDSKEDEEFTTAQAAHGYRHQVRMYVRERGPLWAEWMLKFRDWWLYGHSSGPTFEETLEKYGSCEAIIGAAERTNPYYNSKASVTHPM